MNPTRRDFVKAVGAAGALIGAPYVHADQKDARILTKAFRRLRLVGEERARKEAIASGQCKIHYRCATFQFQQPERCPSIRY